MTAEDPNWLQYITTGVLTLFGGAFVFINSRISKMEGTLEKKSMSENDKIWTALKSLENKLDGDRNATMNSRISIAENMVTRVELAEAVNRIMERFDRLQPRQSRQ